MALHYNVPMPVLGTGADRALCTENEHKVAGVDIVNLVKEQADRATPEQAYPHNTPENINTMLNEVNRISEALTPNAEDYESAIQDTRFSNIKFRGIIPLALFAKSQPNSEEIARRVKEMSGLCELEKEFDLDMFCDLDLNREDLVKVLTSAGYSFRGDSKNDMEFGDFRISLRTTRDGKPFILFHYGELYNFKVEIVFTDNKEKFNERAITLSDITQDGEGLMTNLPEVNREGRIVFKTLPNQERQDGESEESWLQRVLKENAKLISYVVLNNGVGEFPKKSKVDFERGANALQTQMDVFSLKWIKSKLLQRKVPKYKDGGDWFTELERMRTEYLPQAIEMIADKRSLRISFEGLNEILKAYVVSPSETAILLKSLGMVSSEANVDTLNGFLNMYFGTTNNDDLLVTLYNCTRFSDSATPNIYSVQERIRELRMLDSANMDFTFGHMDNFSESIWKFCFIVAKLYGYDISTAEGVASLLKAPGMKDIPGVWKQELLN